MDYIEPISQSLCKSPELFKADISRISGTEGNLNSSQYIVTPFTMASVEKIKTHVITAFNVMFMSKQCR